MFSSTQGPGSHGSDEDAKGGVLKAFVQRVDDQRQLLGMRLQGESDYEDPGVGGRFANCLTKLSDV